MSEPDEEPEFKGSWVIALSEQEWKENLPDSIERGLSQPGDTYGDYLRKLHRMFGFVCLGHHHRATPSDEDKAAGADLNKEEERSKHDR